MYYKELQLKAAFLSAIERLKELEYININKHVNPDAIASFFIIALEELERDMQKHEDLQRLYDALDKHFPDRSEKIIKSLFMKK